MFIMKQNFKGYDHLALRTTILDFQNQHINSILILKKAGDA